MDTIGYNALLQKQVLKQKHVFLFGCIALFIVYFWFGMLKVFDLSPATPLVHQLFSTTFLNNLVSFELFFFLFGIFEACIGLLFLFPKMKHVALLLVVLHLFTTSLPLVLLPSDVWTLPLVPTLEGQYIIKNIVLLALAVVVFYLSPSVRQFKKA